MNKVSLAVSLLSALSALIAAAVTFYSVPRAERIAQTHITDKIEVAAGQKWKASRARVRRLRRQAELVSAQRITDLAGLLAGRKRTDVRDEWRAHLSGEVGQELPAWRKFRAALGFVLAALRYRFQDVTDLAWRPVDNLLASRDFSNVAVLLATLSVVVIFIREGGLYGLADHLESVAVVWGASLGVIHVGRQWRGVKPPEREQRRRSR